MHTFGLGFDSHENVGQFCGAGSQFPHLVKLILHLEVFGKREAVVDDGLYCVLRILFADECGNDVRLCLSACLSEELRSYTCIVLDTQ